jgi:hypothetical protein
MSPQDSHPRCLQSPWASAYHHHLLRFGRRSNDHLPLSAHGGIDNAGHGPALSPASYTPQPAAHAGGNVIKPSLCRLIRQLRISQERSPHNYDIRLISAQYILRQPGIIDSAYHHYWYIHHFLDRCRESHIQTPQQGATMR